MTSFIEEVEELADWGEQQWRDQERRAMEYQQNREDLARAAVHCGLTDDEFTEHMDDLERWLRESHSTSEILDMAESLAERGRE